MKPNLLPMRPSLAGLALSALLSLSACGGGGGGTTPAPAPPVAVTPPTTPPVALLPRAEGEPIVLAGVQYDDTEPGQFVNGPGASARFYHVRDLAIDKAGNVFVADAGNCAIRKITPYGMVSTLAGGQRCATPDGDAARFDGAGGNAAFYQLSRMVIDAADNLYVADGAAIRKITPQGVVSTLAGQLAEGEPSADGIGAAARFYGILELAASPNGSLLVQDSTLRPAVEGHWLFCVETREFNFLRDLAARRRHDLAGHGYPMHQRESFPACRPVGHPDHPGRHAVCPAQVEHRQAQSRPGPCGDPQTPRLPNRTALYQMGGGAGPGARRCRQPLLRPRRRRRYREARARRHREHGAAAPLRRQRG
jgi:hypothetical protein